MQIWFFGLIIGLALSTHFVAYQMGRNSIIQSTNSENRRIENELIKSANKIANDIWKTETALQRKSDNVVDIGGMCIDIDALHQINSIR